MTDDAEPQAPPAPDPTALLRSRNFVVLLVFSALIGVIVSLLSWGFLELVHQTQIGVFTDLPDRLGFSNVPWWWPLPVLFVAGIVVAAAIVHLPGNGGHVPAHGLQVGSTEPAWLPGIALAAFATLALGAVLGPEAPLIAIGSGLAVFTVKLAKRDAPPQLLVVLGAAGSFAAISVVLGSPIVAAVLVIEASGLGGAMLPLILIPGLIAGGIGSLVFIGMASFTGLSTSAYSLTPLQLAPFTQVTWEEIGWTILLGLAAAGFTFVVRQLGLAGVGVVTNRPMLWIPAAGIAVAVAAIVFEQSTTHGAEEVLFSGQDQLPGLVSGAGSWSLGALALLLLWKGLAWSVSLAGFRGGPTFPALFLGAAGGIAASHLPALPQSVAIAVGMGAMVAAFLKLPLTAVILSTALTVSAGASLVPLIIVGVVVAYLATLALEGVLGSRRDAAAVPAVAPAPVAAVADPADA
jgi:chloride channel protein, CIC family